MKRYETYKPSGIEWLEEIPEHWEVRRVKEMFTVNPNFTKKNFDKNTQVSFTPMECLRCGQIEKRTIDYATAISYVPFKNNDILMAKVTPCFENGNIAIADDLENGIGFGSSEIYVIRSNEKYINRKLAFYLFQSNYFRSIGISSMKGTGGLKRVDPISLNTVSFPNISLQEQTILANYLDTKTSTIDRKIELLSVKADKYKALRRSLINESVCRGLNPKVPQKDSGIEWIGMIPEHWEVKRFKEIAFSITGLTYSPDDIVDEDEGILVLRSGNIQNGELALNDKVYVNSNIGTNLFVRKGDILLCSRNGSANLVGKSAFIDKSYNYTWGAFMTVARSKMGRFLFYALNSDLFKRNMGLFQTSTVNQLTSKMLDNMAFLVPMKEEQIEIVDYLDTKTTQINTILTNINEQINKLTQLRKTLINNVVTGKIKVTE